MMTDEIEVLTIGDKRVDKRLIETRQSQRCRVEECQSWCCTGGVWVDRMEKERILANAELVKSHLPPARRDVATWFDGDIYEDSDFPSGQGEGTQVVTDTSHRAGQTCVFLRPEDRRCALQAAAIENGQHPWTLKPYYCALHPITFFGDLVRLDDDNEIYGEGGHCQRDHSQPIALYETFKDELTLILGEQGYRQLVDIAHQQKP